MTPAQEALYKNPAFLKKRSEIMQRQWKDPKYRKKVIAKQKQLGYRNYGNKP